MIDIEKGFDIKFDKRYNIFFKKMYYVLITIINYEGEELRTIIDLLSQILNINKKTCYRYVRELTDLKILKQENKFGKKIITVIESTKHNLYQYLLPAYPLIYQDMFGEIIKKRIQKIRFDKTELTSALEKYTKEIEELMIDVIKREIHERFIPKSFPTIIRRELFNYCKDKIQKTLLF
ncbi:MAG: hypothetical protein KGD63_13055 [Candidatus Lokiarchaeota archaeon]|nr:hypothetical protein [Candidatus Lokiarchaeota archaeon]